MTTTLLCMGQSAPAATTQTTLYTVPSSTTAIVSSIVVSNNSATSDKFRIAVQVGGAGLSAKQYLYYGTSIAGNDTFIATVGLTLSATDVISVYSTNGTLAFQIFGQQNS